MNATPLRAFSTCLRGGALLLVLGGFSACTSVGEKSFACPGRPAGVRCMSASEVYEATHSTDFVAPTAAEAIGSNPARVPRSRRDKTHERSRPATAPALPAAPHTIGQPTDNLIPAIDKPIPVRTPAQVMRAWIAPWEDARGVAHSGEHIFIEIESRRWVFGDAMSTHEPVRLFSIQSAVDSKDSVGKDRSSAKASSGASEREKRNSTLPKEPSHVPKPSESRP